MTGTKSPDARPEKDTTPVSPTEPSQLPATIPTDEGMITSAKFSDDQAGAIKALRFNGISKSRAKRIMSAACGAKFLRQEVMGSVVLNFELPSAAVAEKMLKYCAKLIRSKDTPISDKIKLMEAFPGLQRELTQTVRESVMAAQKFNPLIPPTPKPPIQIGVNVSNNNFPPLAPMPERVRKPLLAGESENDREL